MKGEIIMLVKKTNQLIEETNELKDLCFKQIYSDILEDMDDENLVLFTKMFKLLNTSMEVVKEQAEVIESINDKLDELLIRKES